MKRYWEPAWKGFFTVLLSGVLPLGILFFSWQNALDEFAAAFCYGGAFLLNACFYRIFEKRISSSLAYAFSVIFISCLFWIFVCSGILVLWEEGYFSSEAFPFSFRIRENSVAAATYSVLCFVSVAGPSCLAAQKNARGEGWLKNKKAEKRFHAVFLIVLFATAAFFLSVICLFLKPTGDGESDGWGAFLAVAAAFVAGAVFLLECGLWRGLWKLSSGPSRPKRDRRFVPVVFLSLFSLFSWIVQGMSVGFIFGSGAVLGTPDTEGFFLLLLTGCFVLLWLLTEAREEHEK